MSMMSAEDAEGPCWQLDMDMDMDMDMTWTSINVGDLEYRLVVAV
jgi:hypothetical protein